jgi:hypothetical protein
MNRKLAVSMLLLLACTGCFRPLFPGSEKVFGNDVPRTRGDSETSPNLGLLRKRVSEKQEPATLLSADGFRCTANQSRFNDVKIGDFVWCAWKKQ